MKVLAILAHLDDEFAIIQHLINHHQSKDTVEAIYFSLPIKPSYRKNRLREHQRARVLSKPFIHKETILNFSDTQTHTQVPAIQTKLLHYLKKNQPDLIYIPAYEGGNIDHDIIHSITALTCKRHFSHINIKEFPLYNGNFTRLPFLPYNFYKFIKKKGTHQENLHLTSKQQQFKRKYFRRYTHQYFPTLLFIALFNHPKNVFSYELTRPLPQYDYTQKPTSKISYEHYRDLSFSNFQLAIRHLLDPSQKPHRFSPKPYTPWLPIFIKKLTRSKI